MLYTKIQPKSFLSSGIEVILQYMGIAGILFNSVEHSPILSTSFRQKDTM